VRALTGSRSEGKNRAAQDGPSVELRSQQGDREMAGVPGRTHPAGGRGGGLSPRSGKHLTGRGRAGITQGPVQNAGGGARSDPGVRNRPDVHRPKSSERPLQAVRGHDIRIGVSPPQIGASSVESTPSTCRQGSAIKPFERETLTRRVGPGVVRKRPRSPWRGVCWSSPTSSYATTWTRTWADSNADLRRIRSFL
jgi:hypothetical protein